MAFMPNNMPIDDNDHLQSIMDDNIANRVMDYNDVCMNSRSVVHICTCVSYCNLIAS